MEKQATNTLKALAVTAVILIHFFSAYILIYSPPASREWKLNAFFDQMMRFSVPLFIALSGYGLGKKYLHAKLQFKDFYIRRVTKILPWYLFFSLIFYLYLGPKISFGEALLTGRADYHLYFIPMVFQLYLLFPLIFFISKRWPVIFLVTAFIWQGIYYFFVARFTETLTNSNMVFPDQQQYRIFFSWIFYFILGTVIAIKKKEWLKRKTVVLVFLILSAVGFIFTYKNFLYLVSNGIHIIVAGRFTRIPVLIYSSSLIASGIFVIPAILKIIPKSLERLVNYSGEISFIAYLVHTLVLRLFFNYLHAENFPFELPIAILVVLVSFISAHFISYTGGLLYNNLHELRN